MNESMERELAAMSEIGARRLRIRTAVFVIAVVALMAAFELTRSFGLHVGWLYRGFIAVPVAGGLAVAISKYMNPRLIADAAAKYDLPVEALAADKYLID